MRDNAPTSINNLFHMKNFQHISEKASYLNQLHHLLEQILPSYFSGQYRIGNLTQGLLVIEVCNGALANRFKFERMNILSQLRQRGLSKLSSIEIKIQPDLYRHHYLAKQPVKATAPARKKSPETAKILRENAKDLPDAIKERLQNIARLIEK